MRHYLLLQKRTSNDGDIPSHLLTKKQAYPSDMQIEVLRIVPEDVPSYDLSEDLVSQQALPPTSADRRAY